MRKIKQFLKVRRGVRDAVKLSMPYVVMPSEEDASSHVYLYLNQVQDDREVYDAVLDELLETLWLNKSLLKLNRVSRAEIERQLILFAYAVGFEAGRFDENMYQAGDDVPDIPEDIDFGDEDDDDDWF